MRKLSHLDLSAPGLSGGRNIAYYEVNEVPYLSTVYIPYLTAKAAKKNLEKFSELGMVVGLCSALKEDNKKSKDFGPGMLYFVASAGMRMAVGFGEDCIDDAYAYLGLDLG